ncbi:putative 3-demethylubiquinone-9 3-methyltransferase (glyoxalase superfamily) [Rhizobium mesoamericanum]|uniref:VOC family protein n=1 Tax=Rhizobium mesoamericanum TaxID=1079800 RepID=UPI002785CCDA|nr:VOC family protein [Rhizobium mesoamericanum]MDQ0560543.1 putative 3-demethylubiquinone-9 3-methyltransferase (glyoxalase superfamily) [Rhizobium mesoamericanum]
MLKITSNLWFEKEVLEAVEFYVATIPNSSMSRTTVLPAKTPSGPPGSVIITEFRLGSQEFVAMQASLLDAFNHAFSISVQCETQAEIDRIWNAFLQNGGVEEQCGWLRDRWGLCWQIVPRVLIEMIADPDRERAKRVTEVMLGMVKLDIAKLEAAYR